MQHIVPGSFGYTRVSLFWSTIADRAGVSTLYIADLAIHFAGRCLNLGTAMLSPIYPSALAQTLDHHLITVMSSFGRDVSSAQVAL